MHLTVRRLAWTGGRHSQFDERIRSSPLIAVGKDALVEFSELTGGLGRRRRKRQPWVAA